MITLTTPKGVTQHAESEEALLTAYNAAGTRRYEVRVHDNGRRVLWDRVESRKVGWITREGEAP